MEILNGESELFTITRPYEDSTAPFVAGPGGYCYLCMPLFSVKMNRRITRPGTPTAA